MNAPIDKGLNTLGLQTIKKHPYKGMF